MTDATMVSHDEAYLRIAYTARTGAGQVVDTTDPEVATEGDLAELDAAGPIVVVPGEGHVFEPVEDELRDADPGETVEVTVDPEDAFGAVDPSQTTTLDIEAVAPENRDPGMTVDLGGRRAVVEEIDDESVTVDFDHPMAGVTLVYEIEVLDRLEDTGERIEGLATTHGLREATFEYDSDAESLTVRVTGADPDADRDTRLRNYVADVRRLLPVETVSVVTEYH